jgi:hypothetical protein
MDQFTNFLSQNRKIIIIGLVLLVLVWFLGKQKHTDHTPNNSWDKVITHEFNSLLSLFGKPSQFDNNNKGGATWTIKQLSDTPFARVELNHDMVYHSIPEPHLDFLKTWVYVDLVPKDKLYGLPKISKNIQYSLYGEKAEDKVLPAISVKCNGLVSNVVTHWLIKKYITDELTLDEAVGKYSPLMMELWREGIDSTQFKQLYSEI